MAAKANANLLHNVYLFKELSPQELEYVSAVATTEPHHSGDEIFSSGDEARAMYVIKFGSVRVEHSRKDFPIDVANLGTGSHFGEMAFVDGERRSASVIALEPTELVRLEFDQLRKVLETHPSVAVKVYRSLAHFLCGRLRVTTTDLSFAREKNLRHF